MPWVAFKLKQEAAALKQLLAAEAATLFEADSDEARMRIAMLRREASGG